MSAIRGFSELVLTVRDQARMVAFYRDVVGLPVISPPGESGPVFLGVGPADAEVRQALVLAPAPPDLPAWPAERPRRLVRHFAFEVSPSDFEAERRRLEAQGIEIRPGEHPFLPLQGLYFDDPEGNEVELMARRA